VNRGTGDRFVGLRVRGLGVNRITGDRFLDCQGCKCEQRLRGLFGWIECQGCEGRHKYLAYFGWIECQRCEHLFGFSAEVKESGAVTAVAFRGRPLPYISCQNSTSGDVSRPVIEMCGGVQFVVDRNTER
jgi:hypothetical protein